MLAEDRERGRDGRDSAELREGDGEARERKLVPGRLKSASSVVKFRTRIWGVDDGEIYM